MTLRLRSGFAQFPSHELRRQFETKVLASDARLKGHAYRSSSQPTIIFESLTDSDCERVQSALERLGLWFEDVQFEPMTKPAEGL